MVERFRFIPDAPTVAEQGFAGFEASTWWALFAPKGTPPEVVNRLSEETRKAATSPEFQQRLRSLGGVATGSTPEAMGAFVAAERARWTKIIVEGKITSE